MKEDSVNPPSPVSSLSDWVDLTTNGTLEYNYQTGEVREKSSNVVKGQLPTYEVASEEFEGLAAIEPKPKRPQVRGLQAFPTS
jgi:hypothetical protein